MKTICTKLSTLLWLIFSFHAKSQGNGSPKNFPEVFAGVEWNSISGLKGVNFERYLFHHNKWTFGVKGTHAFEYEVGNMELNLFSSSYDGRESFTSLTGTVHKFFSRKNSGFFLCSELGLGQRKRKYYEYESSTMFTAFEGGLGWQFRVGDKVAIRWTNTLTFAGHGGITMTKLSVGF